MSCQHSLNVLTSLESVETICDAFMAERDDDNVTVPR